jgi:hypothetical protein
MRLRKQDFFYLQNIIANAPKKRRELNDEGICGILQYLENVLMLSFEEWSKQVNERVQAELEKLL